MQYSMKNHPIKFECSGAESSRGGHWQIKIALNSKACLATDILIFAARTLCRFVLRQSHASTVFKFLVRLSILQPTTPTRCQAAEVES